jgi:hypothetical protein
MFMAPTTTTSWTLVVIKNNHDSPLIAYGEMSDNNASVADQYE